MRFHFNLLLLLITVLIFCSCGNQPVLNNSPVFFDIKKGDNIHTISERLQTENVIKDATAFRWYAKISFKDSKLKYGTYQIEPGEKYSDILLKFHEGRIYTIRVTIPEGYNIYQVADILAEKSLVKKEEFLALCTNKEFIAELDIPAKNTLEGYLFPETYQIPVDFTAKKIIQALVFGYKKVITPKMLKDIQARNVSVADVITMASIIEREAKVETEKPLISGVYWQRLKIRMKMQSCPTVIYALTIANRYRGDGKLYFKDLTIESPYNTYIHYGFPPAPIANPGKTSIMAAIYPEKTDSLYFVSKNDGTHYFSKNYSDHLKATKKYQSPGIVSGTGN